MALVRVQMSLPIPTKPWETAKARFLDGLSDSDRTLFNSASPENLFYQSSGRFERFKADNKLWKLQLKLQPLIDAIEGFGKALDVYANAYPLVLSPIWGSIRVVIQLARGFGKYFDRLMDLFAQIGNDLLLFRVYERLFPDHERLLAALADAYLDIIVLCVDARYFFDKAKKSSVTWSMAGKVLWRSFEKRFNDEQLGQFSRHRKAVEKQVGLSHMIEAKEARELEKANQIAQQESMREAKRRKLLSALSTVDYVSQNQGLRDLRHPGTCNWILQDDSFSSWRHANRSSCFAIYGIPGSGKTVLCASIAEELTSDFDGPNSCLCYYYCDYADPKTLDFSVLLGTLIRQLLSRQEIPTDIENQITASCDDDRKFPTRTLLDIFRRVIITFSTCLIIVDGIDELSKESQTAMVAAIKSIMALNKVLVKFVTSCRVEEHDIRRQLRGNDFYHFEISPNALSKDINLFVKDQIHERLMDGQLVTEDPDLQEEVQHALTAGAKDMFLWVKFQLDDICASVSDTQIRQALRDLPRDLGETYARIIKKIRCSGLQRFDTAIRMFKWIGCARRPLHIEELREAVSLDKSQKQLDFSKKPSGDGDRLIQLCGNLAVLDRRRHCTVRFAHHTVQRFLFHDYKNYSFSIEYSEILFSLSSSTLEAEIAELCLTYLGFSDFETQVARQNLTTLGESTDVLNAFVYSQFPTTSAVSKRVGSLISGRIQGKPASRVIDVDLNAATPGQSLAQGLYEKYRLLEYITHHWIQHVSAAPTLATDSKLRDIVFHRHFLIEVKPWKSEYYENGIVDPAPPHIALFRWMVDEDSETFFQLLKLEAQKPDLKHYCTYEEKYGVDPVVRAVRQNAFKLIRRLVPQEKAMSIIRNEELLAQICEESSDAVFTALRKSFLLFNASSLATLQETHLYIRRAIERGNLRLTERMIELTGLTAPRTNYKFFYETLEWVVTTKQSEMLGVLLRFIADVSIIEHIFNVAIKLGNQHMARIILSSQTERWPGIRLVEAVRTNSQVDFDSILTPTINLNEAWSLNGHILYVALRQPNTYFIDCLLGLEQVSIDVQDADGNKLLHHAARHNSDLSRLRRHLVWQIERSSGILHFRNNEGFTPLEIAVYEQSHNAFPYLLSQETSIEVVKSVIEQIKRRKAPDAFLFLLHARLAELYQVLAVMDNVS